MSKNKQEHAAFGISLSKFDMFCVAMHTAGSTYLDLIEWFTTSKAAIEGQGRIWPKTIPEAAVVDPETKRKLDQFEKARDRAWNWFCVVESEIRPDLLKYFNLQVKQEEYANRSKADKSGQNPTTPGTVSKAKRRTGSSAVVPGEDNDGQLRVLPQVHRRVRSKKATRQTKRAQPGGHENANNVDL